MAKSKSLANNAVFNIIYRILNVIFPLISVTYISRILMPEGVGEIAYAQNIVSYFTLFAALGIPTYGTREISKCRDNQNKTDKVFSELFIINAFSTSICIVAYLILVFINFEAERYLFLICGLLIFFNFINIDWFYQGREEYIYIAVRSSLIKIFSLILMFILVKDQSDYLIYALITCLATGGNYIFNIIHSRKYVRFTFKDLKLKRHLKPILYLIVCVISAELYSKVDTTMLGSMCSDEVVGFYTNAQKFVTTIITLTTAISAIFLPRISYYYGRDKEKYNKYITFGFNVLSFFTVPAFVGVILISPDITFVMFGEAFMPAAITINILAALILIKSFGDLLCYQVIISSGNEKKMFKSYIIAAIANIFLNVLLIPVFSQNGAAVASVISEFLLNITLFITVSLKVIKLNINKKQVISVLLGTVLMAICVILTGSFVDNHFIALILEVVIGVGVYVLTNLVLKNKIVILSLNKFISKIKKNDIQ